MLWRQNSSGERSLTPRFLQWYLYLKLWWSTQERIQFLLECHLGDYLLTKHQLISIHYLSEEKEKMDRVFGRSTAPAGKLVDRIKGIIELKLSGGQTNVDTATNARREMQLYNFPIITHVYIELTPHQPRVWNGYNAASFDFESNVLALGIESMACMFIFEWLKGLRWGRLGSEANDWWGEWEPGGGGGGRWWTSLKVAVLFYLDQIHAKDPVDPVPTRACCTRSHNWPRSDALEGRRPRGPARLKSHFYRQPDRPTPLPPTDHSTILQPSHHHQGRSADKVL